MKQEFKWILNIELTAKSFKKAETALTLAQDAFFDSLNNSLDEGISEWEVLDEELK